MFVNNSKSDTYKVEIRKNKDNALIVDAFELAAGKSISTLTLLEAPEFGNTDSHGHDHSIPRRQADRHAEYGADLAHGVPLAKECSNMVKAIRKRRRCFWRWRSILSSFRRRRHVRPDRNETRTGTGPVGPVRYVRPYRYRYR